MSETTKEQWEKINAFNDDSANDDSVVVACLKRIIKRHELGITAIRATTVLDELYYAYYDKLLKIHDIAGAKYNTPEIYDPCKDDSAEYKQELKDAE